MQVCLLIVVQNVFFVTLRKINRFVDITTKIIKIIALSLQCPLAVRNKMATLIIDATKLLDILGLPTATLSKLVQIPLITA